MFGIRSLIYVNYMMKEFQRVLMHPCHCASIQRRTSDLILDRMVKFAEGFERLGRGKTKLISSMQQVEWPGVEIRLHKHSSDNKIFSSSFVLGNQSNRVQCSLYSMTAKSVKPGSNYTKARSREEAQVLHLPTFVNHRLQNILLHIYGPSRIALLVTLLVFRRRSISYCSNWNRRELSAGC